MKNLYDKDDRYTDTAREIDRKTQLFVQPLLRLYVAQGYRPRQIAQIIEASVQEEMHLQLLEFKGE